LNGQISAAEVRALLGYDPESGQFRWAKNMSCKVRAGAIAGGANDRGYIVIRIAGVGYRAHRLAWLHVHGEWPDLQIDHINGIRNDNRIANLRLATVEINAQNRRSNKRSKSGLLGVVNGKRPSARIEVAGKSIHLGYFDTPEEAHAAYLAAKRELHEGCAI
jgi:hypothetical protein